MSKINWNQGGLITLNQGDTATCTGNLNNGQLYGLFFYNAAGNDATTTVIVTGAQSQEPVLVKVPGTTQNEGLAALCFVDGSKTNTVSIAITQGNPGANIQAFICSVKMPLDTNGINNENLPLDGQLHPFNKFTRFYSVPASHWYAGQIQSDINQFISVQFEEQRAKVFIVNATQSALQGNPDFISYLGEGTKDLVEVKPSATQEVSFTLQGNGRQLVWMNADSTQNSKDATISVQSLSNVYEASRLSENNLIEEYA
ncbi:hypothetical protein [Tenacibaculum sp. 190524A02b]|uniref:Uncharacterized protein n=1 Tax=Tenacibaculum vairaonense TaxID=3137860 RepID=A0ABM9PLS8_9FLAO